MLPTCFVDRTPFYLVRAGDAANARADVLLVHGLGEHSGRYAALMATLAASGLAVTAYDQRGHGQSGGARGAIPRHDSLLADLACVVDTVRAAQPVPRPVVLLGHSMGGAVAARFAMESWAARPAPWARPLDALVLSSPALAANLSVVQRWLMVLGRAVPDLAASNGLSPAWISRDPAVVQAYRADPLVHDRITPRLARFILDAGEQVRAAAPQWSIPTLLLWAGADRCVAARGSRELARAAPAACMQAREWPALFHEIFNEPERDDVLRVLAKWLAELPARRPA
jgi:alpha-beta hydrolase superfamily lysophospholipase